MQKAADEHAAKGGDTKEPNMFTVSFPGSWRGTLFQILDTKMHLKLGDKNGDVHAMNDSRKRSGIGAVGIEFPEGEDWERVMRTKNWRNFVKYLKAMSNSGKYKDGKTAPEWFVEHWGPAALHCAVHHEKLGTGVIIFKALNGYNKSKWCMLEFMFCLCLVEVFPNSVYVIDKVSQGHYLKPDETLAVNGTCAIS